MPSFPIVDTHLHLWDTKFLRYPWLEAVPAINRPFLLEDYVRACGEIAVAAMVFVQCEAEFSAFEAEAAWVAEQAVRDPRIQGLVAWAPLEKGRAVAADLERLARHGFLRGIRRIIQFEDDLEFCLQPKFMEGVRTLAEFNLSFDICIDYRHMENILKFVAAIPEVPMVLDHIGKPAIKDNRMQPWARQMQALARFPNVSCKISGVATEADHRQWRPDDLKPYIEVAIEAFGFERVMFGADWPVATQAIRFERWVELLDELLAGTTETERKRFWRDNAARFYRLKL